jgi:hypothetical protein
MDPVVQEKLYALAAQIAHLRGDTGELRDRIEKLEAGRSSEEVLKVPIKLCPERTFAGKALLIPFKCACRRITTLEIDVQGVRTQYLQYLADWAAQGYQ